MRAVFDRYSPILDLDEAISEPDAEFGETVHRVYRLLAEAFSREPRVAPAMLAEGLARPTEPAVLALLQYHVPRMLAGVGQWLAGEVTAGRVRDLPLPLLIQQMLAPIAIHTMVRPAAVNIPEIELPELDEACVVFADAFLRAVAI